MVGEDKSYYFFFDRRIGYHLHEYHINKKTFLKFPLFYSPDGNTMHFIHMNWIVNDFMITGTTIPSKGRIAFRLVGDMTYAHHYDKEMYRHNIFTLGDYEKKLQTIRIEQIYNQKYTFKRTFKYKLNEHTTK